MYPSYEKYKQLKMKGLRKEANACVRNIIEEYLSSPDERFPYQILEDADGNHKVNYLLFKKIVYPYLKPRLDKDPDAIRKLISNIQNLYQDKEIHRELGLITEKDLLRRLISICPNDTRAKNRLIIKLFLWLDYIIHEWPMGILYGQDGATYEECQEILDAVEELRQLDNSDRYRLFTEDVESKVKKYRERIANMNFN